MSQSDRAASKGQSATSELDASTTTYWNGGTPKASLHRRHHPLEAAPASCAAASVPQPVRFWLWSLTCWVDAGLGGSGLPAAAQARPTPALLQAGSPDRRGAAGSGEDQHRAAAARAIHVSGLTPAVPTGRWQRGVTRLAVEGAQIHAALAGRS
jgi:hypothetical protein